MTQYDVTVNQYGTVKVQRVIAKSVTILGHCLIFHEADYKELVAAFAPGQWNGFVRVQDKLQQAA